jgi:hypothetical protein
MHHLAQKPESPGHSLLYLVLKESTTLINAVLNYSVGLFNSVSVPDPYIFLTDSRIRYSELRIRIRNFTKLQIRQFPAPDPIRNFGH